MSPISMTAVTPWIGGHDFTADSNKLTLSADAVALDSTTFASGGWNEHVAGLKTITGQLSGFWSSAAADSVDSEVFANLGAGGEPFTASPSGTALDPAYMFLATKLKYGIGDVVGNLAPFSLDVAGGGPGVAGATLVRGQVAKGRGSVAGTGVLGSGLNLGAVSATQSLYASLHVLGTPGTSITVSVESDDNSGFTSPATVATIGSLTAAGGTWVKVAGALTDSYFRFKVSAIVGTFVVAGAIGIA